MNGRRRTVGFPLLIGFGLLALCAAGWWRRSSPETPARQSSGTWLPGGLFGRRGFQVAAEGLPEGPVTSRAGWQPWPPVPTA